MGLWDRTQVTGLNTKHLFYLLRHHTYHKTDMILDFMACLSHLAEWVFIWEFHK